MSKEAIQYINATLAAFGPDEAISMTQETWAKLREAMRAVAEQPAQQEPVAYLCENAVGHKYFRWKKPSSTYKPIALYTSLPAQRTWVSLTDEEIFEIHKQVDSMQYLTFGHAIEAKLKEKNNG